MTERKYNCRIGTVNIKNTNQTIKIVPKVERTEIAQKLIDNMLEALECHPDPKAFMFIILDSDGTYSTRTDADNFPFGYATFIEVVKTLLNRDIITNSEVKWFCKQQGWIND